MCVWSTRERAAATWAWNPLRRGSVAACAVSPMPRLQNLVELVNSLDKRAAVCGEASEPGSGISEVL